MQLRRGPNRVGPFGLLQTLADTVKLLIKEDIIPDAADQAVFRVAPIIVLAATFLLFVVLPFGKGLDRRGPQRRARLLPRHRAGCRSSGSWPAAGRPTTSTP